MTLLISGEAARAPIIIGATGGSGTRVVARVVRDGGLFIGTELNVSDDALGFGGFSDRWINRYLKYHQSAFGVFVNIAMKVELKRVLTGHLMTSHAGQRWGWKEPRSIYLLPFFNNQFSGCKFVHVVRDGRDMALSSNQNQLNKHGDQVLGAAWQKRSPVERSIALWTAINVQAAHYGETVLQDRYLRVRFEDLCHSPQHTISRLFSFAGLSGDIQAIAQRHLSPPSSLGRWQAQAMAVQEKLYTIGQAGLKKFGYS